MRIFHLWGQWSDIFIGGNFLWEVDLQAANLSCKGAGPNLFPCQIG